MNQIKNTIEAETDSEIEVDINKDLLRFEGVLSESILGVLYRIAGVIIVIIVVSSVFVIRNSFSISVSEKTKQYGMLASVGATKKQIKRSVLLEGLYIGIIAIPLGILLGIVAIIILLWIVNLLLVDMMEGTSFVYDVPGMAILISVVISGITIFLSCLIPAIKASKIPPIEAIRGTDDIKIKTRKIKTSKLTKKLFGIGGVIARKNLKRNRKKYRVVKNLYFESNDVLSFKLSDNNYCAIICAQITQEKSQITYDFVLTTYKGKQKPTIETLKDEFIVGHLMGGPSRKEILKQQPKIDILWDYHTHNAILLTEAQRQRTYSNDSIEIFEGKKEFFFGFPFKLVTHKDMTLMKDKFEVIGKLKIKENFNRSGGYDYLSNLERFEDILNDIDRHMEIFRNVKFPIKLLCEIN